MMRGAQRRHCRSVVRIVAACICCAVAISGCATAPTHGPVAAGDLASVAPGLERLASRESTHPSQRSMRAPPPPGVDASLLALVAPDDSHAREALADVIKDLAASDNAPSPNDDKEQVEVDGQKRAEATRLYVSGRLHRLEGDAASAIRDLDAASELDPQAAAPWRELGEAYLLSGDRFSAAAAFSHAIELEPTDLRSLVEVGLTMHQRRRHDKAAWALARAWPLLKGADPALPHIVGLALGRSLHELGALAAGAEAIREALDLPDRFEQPTIYRDELADVYRARGDAWRDVGDVDTQLGDYEHAIEAYDKASKLPTLDPGAILARRVYAAMRLGRPAQAALDIISQILHSDGRVEERQLRLLGHLASASDVGPAIVKAIDALERTLPQKKRRLVAGQLVRARAASMPDDEARRTLRLWIAKAPSDQTAVADLYGRLDPEDTTGLLIETIRLIEVAPYDLPEHLDALLRVEPGASSLLEAWLTLPSDEQQSAEAVALRALLLTRTGDVEQGLSLLRDLASRQGPPQSESTIWLAQTMARLGRHDEAMAQLDQLDLESDPAMALAAARVLYSLRAYGKAFDAIASILPASGHESPDKAPIALLAGDLAAALERWGESARWRQLAIDLDPTLEKGYAGLIELYAPSGPLADQSTLSQLVRRLRSVIPSSRTLRWLRAQDLVRAGQLDHAQRELLSLAEERPTRQIVNLLVSLWIQTGSKERARDWLVSKAAAHPTNPVFGSELARVLAATGKGEEAVTLLRTWLQRLPDDAAFARQLETILRDALGRTAEADELAMKRLESAPHTAQRTVELTALLLRQNKAAEAVNVLGEALAGDRPIEQPEAGQIAASVVSIGDAALKGGLEPRQALTLYKKAAPKLRPLPLSFYASRTALMALSGASVDEIYEAVDEAAQVNKDKGIELFLRAALRLRTAKRLPDALRLVRRVATTRADADDRVLVTWVQLGAEAKSVDDVTGAIETAVKRHAMNRVASAIVEQTYVTEAVAASEIAYTIAGAVFAQAGDDDGADAMYRLALRHNPRHAMANNNLAYRMVEKGERLPEAQRMLEIAYSQQPRSAAIIDSLAWARYKLGVIEDQVTPEGLVVKEGARTLLARAVLLVEGKNDPTVQDHYGDALWRAGEHDAARTHWTISRSLVQNQLMKLRNAPPLLTALSSSLTSKLEAVDGGAEPPVSDIIGAGETGETTTKTDAVRSDTDKGGKQNGAPL